MIHSIQARYGFAWQASAFLLVNRICSGRCEIFAICRLLCGQLHCLMEFAE
jgi:hypothetical protein